MSKYFQGTFVPRNPSKYVGDVTKIFFRSSWERKFLIWLDTNPSVLKYSSEETVIPYFSPIDKKIHKYYVDFTMMYKTAKGEIRREIIEIKPHAQTQPPKKTRNTKRYLNEVMTYTKNDAKWNAAKAWAADNGFVFRVITEYDLGLAK